MRKAAVIGVFDGVHLGHRYLLQTLVAEARKRCLQPIALTFDRHPLEQIRPEAAPPLICPVEERLKLLEQAGVRPEILTFTPEMRQMSAREFCETLRAEGIDLLLMGFNNRIGSDRRRGIELADAPIEVLVAPELPDLETSSSAVRKAVADGDMGLAAKLLGRPFAIEGEVVKGHQIGRTIGFPTANIRPSSPDQLLPALGVYAGRVGNHDAVINIGRRPTLNNGSDISFEAHLIDFQGDLYGLTLRVEFLRRLRSEKKFINLDELKAQIKQDIDHARGE